MPKVYTYNAEFNPLSLAERIAPMQLYKEEYDKQMEAYYKNLEAASTLADLKDSEIDKDSYDIYDAHMNDMRRLGEMMDTVGLTPEAVELSMRLRRNQIEKIDPLISQLGIRSKLIEKQREGQMKDQNLIYDKYYDTIPISKVNSSSTFKPIHLDKEVYEPAFKASASSYLTAGMDLVDYDQFKQAVGYDNLRPEDQRKVDELIGLAQVNGLASYKEYNDKLVTDRLRKTGTGNKAEKSRVVQGLNGEAIIVNFGDNGNPDVIKGFDGKSRVVNYPNMSGMTGKQRAMAIHMAELKAYYGNNDYVGSSLIHGKLPIHIFSNGKSRFILDKNGKMAPIKYTAPDKDDDGFDKNYYKAILQAYYGRNLSFLDGTQTLDSPILPLETIKKYETLDKVSTQSKPFDPNDPNNPEGEDYIKNHADIKLKSINDVLGTNLIDGQSDILLKHRNPKTGEYDEEFWNAFFDLGGYVLLKPRVPRNKARRGNDDICGYDVQLVYTPDRDYLSGVIAKETAERQGGGID